MIANISQIFLSFCEKSLRNVMKITTIFMKTKIDFSYKRKLMRKRKLIRKFSRNKNLHKKSPRTKIFAQQNFANFGEISLICASFSLFAKMIKSVLVLILSLPWVLCGDEEVLFRCENFRETKIDAKMKTSVSLSLPWVLCGKKRHCFLFIPQP
jgi:hypothetical protein